MSDDAGDSTALEGASPETANDPGGTPHCPANTPHWIEIVLLDEAGNPVANEPYLIVTPDGAEHKGSLDGDGYVRLNNIEPGDCQVSFPEIDQHEPVRK
jgi:uncharacterized protein (DUF2345 family)